MPTIDRLAALAEVLLPPSHHHNTVQLPTRATLAHVAATICSAYGFPLGTASEVYEHLCHTYYGSEPCASPSSPSSSSSSSSASPTLPRTSNSHGEAVCPTNDVCPTSKCKHCGATITLYQTGVHTFHWLTNPRNKSSWHCGTDPLHPVKSHSPATLPASDTSDTP